MKSYVNPVGWFEIPVTDMERAIRFYENVFVIKLARNKMGHLDMAWFPSGENAVGSAGSLVYHPDFYKPSHEGSLLYFTTPTGELDKDIEAIENAGGKILVPKTLINEDIGYMCVFEDSEGNRVAIHSRY
ncbi:MAG: VOC family protein [Bacteroidales bacterium]|nr:VOC family protein [Bacteroidales bacterium]